MNWGKLKNAISKFAPIAGSLVGGPAGGAVGGLIANALGVKNTPEAVAAALQSDPEAGMKIRKMEIAHAEQMERLTLESETARLTEINKTMRAEAAADDAYVRRWRPTYGYATAFTWVLQSLAISYAMMFSPENAANIINAVVAMTPMWGIALSILGINVVKRSQDKQVAAGQLPVGILSAFKKG